MSTCAAVIEQDGVLGPCPRGGWQEPGRKLKIFLVLVIVASALAADFIRVRFEPGIRFVMI